MANAWTPMHLLCSRGPKCIEDIEIGLCQLTYCAYHAYEVKAPDHPPQSTEHAAIRHRQPTVLELWNGNCVNIHVLSLFQSSKMYRRWSCHDLIIYVQLCTHIDPAINSTVVGGQYLPCHSRLGVYYNPWQGSCIHYQVHKLAYVRSMFTMCEHAYGPQILSHKNHNSSLLFSVNANATLSVFVWIGWHS